jgi:hypothetical protein
MKQAMRPARIRRAGPGVAALAVLIVVLGSSPEAIGSASSGTAGLPKPTYNAKCEKTAVSQVAMDQCVGGELTQLTSEMQVALNDEGARFGKTIVAMLRTLGVSSRRLNAC